MTKHTFEEKELYVRDECTSSQLEDLNHISDRKKYRRHIKLLYIMLVSIEHGIVFTLNRGSVILSKPELFDEDIISFEETDY